MQQQIATLQEQVNTLFTNLNDLRTQKPPALSPTLDGYSHHGPQSIYTPIYSDPHGPSTTQPRFHGPTSSAFNFDVARSSLQTMGIAEDGIASNETTVHASPAQSPPQPAPALPPVHPTKDPIWTIKREEALRLLEVYEEEIGIMYPFFDIKTISDQTSLLYMFMEAALRTGFAQRGLPGADGLQDDNTNLLKMILAVTLVVEGGGQSELGQRLFMTVKPVIESKIWSPPDIKTVKLFAVGATYHFHTGDDVMAYRLIGIAARMCLEMGLHRRDAIMRSFPEEQQWSDINRTFWSIYLLDRRWSFGTGLPFVIQDDDIDPNLEEPDLSLPYVRCMVPYSRIASKIWYSGLGSEGITDARRDVIGYLDYQVLQWYKQIPKELKLYLADSPKSGESVSRGLRRLRVVLYLRMNQLRILIYRPVLHSAANIAQDKAHAQTVVDVAKDTVRLLTRLNQTSDIYRTQQACFNYFLVAALAVLFLAVCHAPAEFNRQVRDEFYLALDLIRGFSTKSYVSKRLWNTIKGLRKIGEKLGVLVPRPVPPNSNDDHSNAAVAMAGLAGHPIEGLSVYGAVNGVNGLGNSPLDGMQISQELTNLFEAAGGIGNFLMLNTSHENTGPATTGSIDGFAEPTAGLHSMAEGLAGMTDGEGELSRVIRDLF